MTNIFKAASEVGADNIRSILPCGEVDGRGWYTVKNVDRGESEPGSFGVCLSGHSKGAVKDFADPDYDGDVCGLYSKLNHLSMIDAAKDILKSFAPMRLEEFDIKGKPVVKKRMRPIVPIPRNQEPTAYTWPEKTFKSNVDFVYWYTNEDSELLYGAVRFIEPIEVKGKKRKTVHFGLFIKDGVSQFSWFQHPFSGKLKPFSRQEELKNAKNKTVIIVEGEKAAIALEKTLSKTDYIVTTCGASSWFKNADYSIFQKHEIKTVIFWPDNDEPGEGVAKYLKGKFMKVSIVKNPNDANKGWDAYDAIAEGIDPNKYIFDNIKEEQKEKPYYKMIGCDRENAYVMSYRFGNVKEVRLSQITKNFLRILAPDSYWYSKYHNQKNDSVNWDDASDAVMIEAATSGRYDEKRIRQTGAWLEDKTLVFNSGSSLFIKGKQFDIFDHESHFIYEHGEPLGISEELEPVDPSEFFQLLSRLPIADKKSIYALAGWTVLSVIGGCLTWRPHIWLNGENGSGKSYTCGIIQKLLGELVVDENGGSTEAAIRNTVKMTTAPVIVDEMEANSETRARNIEAILFLVRLASSGTRVTRSNQNQGVKGSMSRSMFCLASINPKMAEAADISRLTLIDFDKRLHGGSEHFLCTKTLVDNLLTREYSKRWIWTMITNYQTIIETVELFKILVKDHHGISRFSDQWGSLLAGGYLCERGFSKVPNSKEANLFLKNFQFQEEVNESMVTDSERCLDAAFGAFVDYDRSKYTIASLLAKYFSLGEETVNEKKEMARILKMYGIVVNHKDYDGKILIVYKNKNFINTLKNTAWAGDCKNVLKNHPHTEGTAAKVIYTPEIRGQAIVFPSSIVEDEIPEANPFVDRDKEKDKEYKEKDIYEDEIPF